MIKIETKQLQEGAILAQPVITPLGQPLAPAGSAVTRQLINRMKLYRVEYVGWDWWSVTLLLSAGGFIFFRMLRHMRRKRRQAHRIPYFRHPRTKTSERI